MRVELEEVKVSWKEPPGYCGWMEQLAVKLEPRNTPADPCWETPKVEEDTERIG